MGYQSVSEFWALKIIFSCLFFKFLAESGLLVLCWFRSRGSSLGPISFKTQIGLTVQYLFLSINRLGKS